MLARQVASIYGQASDYAAYFNPANGIAVDPRGEAILQAAGALQTLVQHIEEVLPKLAISNRRGQRPLNISRMPQRLTAGADHPCRIGNCRRATMRRRMILRRS